jgi:hypothetical protein
MLLHHASLILLAGQEQRHSNRKSGLEASSGMVTNLLQEKSIQYDEFIATL